MRTVVGGVLGLILGAMAVAALGIVFDSRAYLAVLVAGVLAGVLMRVMAPGGSMYARGAIAALATALAAVAGPLVATEWFRSQGDAKPLAAAKVVIEEVDTDEEGDQVDLVVEAKDVTPVFSGSQQGAPLRAPANNPFAIADVACLVIGCLAAYQIGKGPEPLATDAEENAAEPETPAEEEASPPPAN